MLACYDNNSKQASQLVLPGVHFPDDSTVIGCISNVLNITGVSSLKIIAFITSKGTYIFLLLFLLQLKVCTFAFSKTFLPAFLSINGKPKQNNLSVCDKIHEEFATKIINHNERLPKNYIFFGSNKNVENLELFIKHNPFIASALSKVNDLMIVSYTPVNAVATAASKGWFERIVDLLDNSYPRVVATFSDTLKVMSI